MVTLIVRSYKIHKTQIYSYKFIYMHIKLHKIKKTLNHNWNAYVNLNKDEREFFFETDASVTFKLQKDLCVYRWGQT
jgi:hypothetical protein